MKLHNSRVVITGGAMGVGFATALRLAKEGAHLTIWDINNDALRSAEEKFTRLGIQSFFHQCDVSDKGQVHAKAIIAKKEMGGVDILINNAGFVAGGNILDQPVEIWEKTIAVNLTALLYTIKEFLPEMLDRNVGHIVNISSAAGTLGVSGLAVYASTKWAVWGLTESLRQEAISLGKPKVKFSTIHPSYIASGMFEGARLRFPGNLIVPLVKDHDVIAEAIVESALKKGRHSPKRPWTVNLTVRMRALFPDFIFQKIVRLLGISESMKTWRGRQ